MCRSWKSCMRSRTFLSVSIHMKLQVLNTSKNISIKSHLSNKWLQGCSHNIITTPNNNPLIRKIYLLRSNCKTHLTEKVKDIEGQLWKSRDIMIAQYLNVAKTMDLKVVWTSTWNLSILMCSWPRKAQQVQICNSYQMIKYNRPLLTPQKVTFRCKSEHAVHCNVFSLFSVF